MVEQVGVVAREDRPPAVRLARRVIKHLLERGVGVVSPPLIAKGLESTKLVESHVQEMEADFIVAIGGDGLILKLCMVLKKPETPILGVNMGTRGLLTEVSPREVFDAIDLVLSGKCALECCTKIASEVDGKRLPDALNEVVVANAQPSKLLTLRVFCNDLELFTIRGDGVIVSTPVGSTAYSLSMGGPAIDSSVSAFVVTPMSPFYPIPPVVIPDDSVIRIKLVKAKVSPVVVVVDGSKVFDLGDGGEVVARKSENHAVFIRLGESSFIKRLRGRVYRP